MAYQGIPQADDYRPQGQDYGRDYGSGRSGSYSSAREYEAAGYRGGRDDAGRNDYGSRAQRDDRFSDDSDYRGASEYRGSYGSGGHRFEDVGGRDRAGADDRYRARDDGRDRDDRNDRARMGDRQQDERGFVARAGDEVRSWFGDEEAERRRHRDEQQQMRDAGRHGRDFGRDHDDYHDWRGQQIAALDRDYDEYRQHNRTKFHSEFGQWRTQRQGQRDQMATAREHQEVVGSDGQHIGTVDHVRDDRILLTKNDQDAGGRHHSIPSSWIQSVGEQVVISRTADEAKRSWRDEENNQAMFGGAQRGTIGQTDAREDGGTTLNRSFSNTY